MNVLVGCEHSGIVREAFRKRGHNAWSCDLLPPDDGSEFHLQADVLKYIDGFEDRFGTWHTWDLAIFHPPCTHLAVSGAHLFAKKQKEQAEALHFVQQLLDAPIPRIALENPIGIISTRIRKPDQIIQPYEFGHDASKKTCLWLKALPKLQATDHITGKAVCENKHVWDQYAMVPRSFTHECPQCGLLPKRFVWANQTPSGQNKLGPSADRWKKRSLTYQGIAEAMAEQWGGVK